MSVFEMKLKVLTYTNRKIGFSKREADFFDSQAILILSTIAHLLLNNKFINSMYHKGQSSDLLENVPRVKHRNRRQAN